MSSAAEVPPLEGSDYIRPFADKDRNMVEQLVGQGFMEGLTTANNRVYTSTKTIALCLVGGTILNLIMGIHKNDFTSWLTYLQLVIGPCFILLPILGIVEYKQRPDFDDRMRTYVRGEDIRAPLDYYTPPGGCWVFEHKGGVIGVVMLDAHSAGKEVTAGKPTSLKTNTHAVEGPTAITAEEATRRRESGKVSQVAELRHVDVDGLYRRTGVGMELVAHALDKAFGIGGAEGSVKTVIAYTSPFTPGGDALWRRAGFLPLPREDGWRQDLGLGWSKWKGHWAGVDRESWLAARAGLYAKYAEDEKAKEGKKDQ